MPLKGQGAHRDTRAYISIPSCWAARSTLTAIRVSLQVTGCHSLPVMVTAKVSPSVRLSKGTRSLESGSRTKAGALNQETCQARRSLLSHIPKKKERIGEMSAGTPAFSQRCPCGRGHCIRSALRGAWPDGHHWAWKAAYASAVPGLQCLQSYRGVGANTAYEP